ncbi:EAL domain-containing protein, partial [Klebsiella pneumoniae]
MQGLQDMGVGLYLDDFGTGYSNMASVLNYPIEVVKVDKSLLSE